MNLRHQHLIATMKLNNNSYNSYNINNTNNSSNNTYNIINSSNSNNKFISKIITNTDKSTMTMNLYPT